MTNKNEFGSLGEYNTKLQDNFAGHAIAVHVKLHYMYWKNHDHTANY